MKVVVEKKEKHVAQISLEIPSEQANQEYNKAWRRLGSRLNIPGFRRGKAPRNIVEKTVGIERIKQEALDRLLPHAFADAISEHQLDIVAPPQIETFNFELEKGINVSASVELRPEAQLPKLEGIKVDVPEFKMPGDAEAKELQAIVERMTTLNPVVGRNTQKNDLVNIDFEGSVNGEAIKGGTAKNFRLDLSNNNFIEGFAEQLIDKKLGEDFTINVTFPADYHDKALAGKPAEFKVKINEISEKVVPALDDELAKKMGSYENVGALKEEIQKLLKQAEDQENLYRKQKAVIDWLLEKSNVEISDSMTERESKILTQELQNRLREQGVTSWEQFLDSQGKDKVLGDIKEEAVKRIKTSLVFSGVAKQEAFSVGEDEFNDRVREMAQQRGVDEKSIMRQLGNNFQAAQALSDQILSQKVVDFLVERAEFKFVPDTEADKKDDKPAPAGDAAAVAAAIEGEEFDVIDEG